MAQTGASYRHKQRRKATPAHTKEGESEVTPERTADRGILGRTFRYNNCGVTRRCCECLERADLMRHCDSCGHCAEPSLPRPRGRPGWPPVSCQLPTLPVCHLHNGVRQTVGELAATRRPHDREGGLRAWRASQWSWRGGGPGRPRSTSPPHKSGATPTWRTALRLPTGADLPDARRGQPRRRRPERFTSVRTSNSTMDDSVCLSSTPTTSKYFHSYDATVTSVSFCLIY